MNKYKGYTKHTTKEFCGAFNIGASSFKHKDRKAAALEKVRLSHEVIVEKDGRSTFYYTKPKNGLLNILNCDIGNKDIAVIESILKIIIDGDIVPVQSEYARITGIGQSTISNTYMTFLKTHEILVPPATDIVLVVHNETREILSKQERKIGTYIYYDITPDGAYVMLNKDIQTMADAMYKKQWAIEGAIIARTQQKYAIQGQDMKGFQVNVDEVIWSRMNRAFKLHNGQRIIKPIINPTIKPKLNEYFGIKAS